jgi:hypothetical protein
MYVNALVFDVNFMVMVATVQKFLIWMDQEICICDYLQIICYKYLYMLIHTVNKLLPVSKHQTMKAYRGNEVKLNTFHALLLDVGE